MSAGNETAIVALLAVSVLAFALPLLYMAVRACAAGRGRRGGRAGSYIPLLAGLLLSVWSLRYAVGYYAIVCAPAEGVALTRVEELFNSFVHALQTFSMDEDYTAYILNGKEMMAALTGGSVGWQTAYGIYASVLNVAAPIAGGAILIEILAGVFPKIRLALAGFAVWRDKYYFSELNAESLAMAKSIAAVHMLCKPILIFTDAYVDEKRERSAELLLEAKRIGAICVRDDLSHIRLNRFGGRKILLMDRREEDNQLSYLELADGAPDKFLNKMEIFFFTKDEVYSLLERRVKEKWEKKPAAAKARAAAEKAAAKARAAEKMAAEKARPAAEKTAAKARAFAEKAAAKAQYPATLRPVHSYRNMVYNTLVSIPLYEPLVGKRRNADGTFDLTVTILGMGDIGKEMFFAAYWFGQMLGCRLHINVLSKGSDESFWGMVDGVNPEIRHTVTEGDPILAYDRHGHCGPAYCSVRYLQCGVESSAFAALLSKGNEAPLAAAGEGMDSLLDTDYFFVSLGADERNIAAAEMLKTYVGQHHIASAGKCPNAKAAIVYVVYDSALSDTLNRKRRFCFVDRERKQADVYMCAVGNLRDVYSVRNVFLPNQVKDVADSVYAEYLREQGQMQRPRAGSEQLGKTNSAYEEYLRAKGQIERRREEAKRRGRTNSVYVEYLRTKGRNERRREETERLGKTNYMVWSNIAKSMHRGYQLFSLGQVTSSVFEDPSMDDPAVRSACYRAYCEACKNFLFTPIDRQEKRAEHIALLHKLAWLEHRRWNAYMRSCGFRHTGDYAVYASPSVKGSYKQMELKLHPCLIECSQNGIRARFQDNFTLDESTLFPDKGDGASLDLLDELSDIMQEKNYNKGDFKYYDYPTPDHFND